MKKFLTTLLILTFLATPYSFAAPKKIITTPLKFVIDAGDKNQFSGLVLSQKNILLFGSISESSTSSAYVRAIDKTGIEQWKLLLEAGAQEIATAGTVDSAGTIWIAGSFSKPLIDVVETATSLPTINPDAVINEESQPIRADMSSVAVWKISPQGELLTSFNIDLDQPALVTAIAIDKNGVSLAGNSNVGKGGFGILLNCSLTGVCNKPLNIGVTDTFLEGVLRSKEGGVILIGNSTETFLAKKVQGVRDGIIVTVSKSGKISKVVRSSAAKASRNWGSATATLFFGGEVITGKKIESSVTAFSNTLIPSWTYRFATTGPIFNSNDATKTLYSFFASTSAITNISGWNPKRASGLVLAFDSKGAVIGSYSAATVTQPRAAAYSKELGLVVAGVSGDTVSIFNLISR